MRVIPIAVALSSAALFGSSTGSWEMNTYQDFMKGRFSGLSMTRDGRLMLAPKLETILSSDQPSIWSVAQSPDNSFYLGTGHRGRLLKVDAQGKSIVLWTASQPEIFAVTLGPDGAVYAGTSPDGKVYRILDGKATEYFAPEAKYIWSLAFGADGALYVGTGDQGKIYRVSGGRGEVYYDTGQAHVTCLALDRAGQLLAGTEPNGILYRIQAKDKAFALYDANLPEIRTIAVAPDGVIYTAALGGSLAQKVTSTTAAAQAGSTGPQVAAPGTSITVTDDGSAAQAGIDIKSKAPPQTPAVAAPAAVSYTPVVDLTGVEKSAVYKIYPDNTVETLWSSKEENVYDLLLSNNQVIFSTDTQGRIYRLGQDRRVTLIAQTGEGETTRLLNANGTLVAATGTMGKLFRLGESAAAEGYYDSPVHDAGSVARWGQLSWRGERKAGAELRFRTRSGNSARPDKTWSDWSEPLTVSRGSAIQSPNARFVQWKAEFRGDSGASPVLTAVNLAYLPQNNPPVVRSINVTTLYAATPAAAKALTQPAAGSPTYSITVTDTGEAGASTLSGTPTQTMIRGGSQQIQLSWQADDPDGDRLVYAVYFRGEEEQQWKLLRASFSESSLLFEGDVFADGKYYFRVVASDKPSNAAGSARESELISAPIMFDNTPPALRIGAITRNGANLQVEFEAEDAASGLRRAEYSFDATAWQPVQALDGIIDGRQERFVIRMSNVPAGEHLLVLRVYDSSNNVGLTKAIIP
jgi:sugar lactone lactonase YvrE